tara:strand:+ start:13975 stop:14976 length:1002 start_codon:yes stop_codon:yes gene_type:complete
MDILYIDKYKPKHINDFIINNNISKKLINIDQYRGNILFHGPSGSGKTTLINAFIDNYFDTKCELKNIKYYLDKTKFVTYKKSDLHYEITINKKKYLLYHNIENIIKHIIQEISLNKRRHKLVFIKNFSELGFHKQYAFKNIFEKSYKYCNFILSVSTLSKVDKALISRTLCIRVPSPTFEELYTFIKMVADKEQLSYTKSKLNKILKQSGRNIYKALLILQLSYSEGKYINHKNDVEDNIKKLFKLVKSKNKNKHTKIREILYFLIKINKNPDSLIKEALDHFLSKDITLEQKHKIVVLSATASHRIACSYKYICHLEYFFFNLIEILTTVE